jgi:hypothetical protein
LNAGHAPGGGVATTSRPAAALRGVPPLTPVMSRLFEFSGVALVVVTVRVEVVVAGFGLNEPVAPVGRPVTARPTEPANPPEGVMVTA